MKKASITIFVVIGIVLAAGLLIFIFQGFNSSPADINCPDAKTDIEISRCLLNISTETNNEALCEEIPLDAYKAGCYKSIARIRLDESFCTWALIQEENCYYELADLKNDEAICENLKEQNIKDGCYFQMAALKKDVSLCEKISDEYSRTTDCPREVSRVSRN